MNNADVYKKITDKIITQMESGQFSWNKPWQGVGEPCNLVSKKAYRGINTWILGSTDYRSPYWVTYKQSRSLGGHVRKGEKSETVVFWKPLKKSITNDDGNSEDKRILLLRYYRVFNSEQCDGIEDKIPKIEVKDNDPLEECEKVWDGYKDKPELVFNNPNRAFYRPSQDTINMPKLEQFDGSEEYYSTLFHEGIHSTGHKSRLGRIKDKECSMFGDDRYSKEELVAEMGAAYLCAVTGIENRTIDNSVAYLQSWIKQLKKDNKLIVNAAAAAQKASDWMLGKEQTNGDTTGTSQSSEGDE